MKKFTQLNGLSATANLTKLVLIFSISLFTFFTLSANTATDNTIAEFSDSDNDGISDNSDNCPYTYNPVQGDYDFDGIGDVCDGDYPHCDKIISVRRVENLSSACSGADGRVIWMDGAYCKEIGNLYFVEYTNGIATLKGNVQELNGGNIVYVDVTFTGKTTSGNPFLDCASSSQSNDWYYYNDFSGTIAGLNVVPNPDHGFQVGYGANVKNNNYGASGWFKLEGTPTDFNFDLSDPLTCGSSNSDSDNDGIADNDDNCPSVHNPVQGDYDNDGLGDACDDDYPNCNSIESVRRVLNLASACGGTDSRVLWQGGDTYKEIGDLYFVEYKNGTATLQGNVQEVGGSNVYYVDVTFTGKSNNGTAYLACGTGEFKDDWYYYSDFSGTVAGQNVVPNPDHGFQVGFGANVKNMNYGASGWFKLNGVATDFNFDLSEKLGCSSDPDNDNDGIPNTSDNCPDTYNPDQADSDQDGTGDVCDPDNAQCNEILSIRRVQNLASACSAQDHRVIWKEGHYYKETGDLYFVEYTDGTATLQGEVVKVGGSSILSVDVTFSGKTTSGDPYFECASSTHSDDWYYYSHFTGTIGGQNVVPNPNHGFQIGYGANVKNNNFGASGWFNLGNDAADFNFDLSEELPCSTISCSGSITGFQIIDADNANGNTVTNFSTDQKYCESQFTSHIQLRALVSGEHESLEFTISGPNGLHLTNTENFVTYDSKLFMSNPGTYTITAKLYKGGDLSGTLCDEQTITLVINETCGISLGDKLFLDTNGNGAQDGGETGVQGVTVRLHAPGSDGQFHTSDDVIVDTDDTDQNGAYSFDEVEAGTYCIEFVKSDLPAGFVFTAQDAAGNDELDSDADADGKIAPFIITAGQADDLDFDAGIKEVIETSIGDKLFFDNNSNGIQETGETGVQGVTVRLHAPGNDGQFHTSDDVIVDTDETDQNGIYSFDDVDPGTYCIEFVKSDLPAGFVFTAQDAAGSDELDSDADADGKIAPFTITAGQADDLDFDAGIKEVIETSIGDKLFFDDNSNGIQETGEAGVQGVTVRLHAPGSDGQFHTSDDVIVDTDETDQNGIYSFDDVDPGTYCIEFVKDELPADYIFTKKDEGNDDSIDSDVDADGKIAPFTITAGQADILDFDAGIFTVGSIGDRVWRDSNANGIQDEGEEGVAGVFIFIEDENGNDLSADFGFQFTGADGAYSFNDLPCGNYKLRFATPTGFILTQPSIGEDDNLNSDAQTLDGRTPVISLTPGNKNVTNVDAGYYQLSDLPVELVRFSAEAENCFTRLNWVTNSEENFSHYEIEWSSSRNNFQNIGIINPSSGRGTKTYFFTHENTYKSNYYRLKMVDIDGQYEYSDIINYNHDCHEAVGMDIFPTVVQKWSASLKVKFFSDVEGAQMHVVNGNGQVVRTFEPGVRTEWNVIELDVNGLSSGMYYIMIDENRQAGKFIIAE